MGSKVRIIVDPTSNQFISLLFYVNRTIHSWDVAGHVSRGGQNILYWVMKKTIQQKKSNFGIFRNTQHRAHLLLKLVDKMCKYDINLTSIVEDTERTQFCQQIDGEMERWTDRQGETSIPPFNFVEAGSMIIPKYHLHEPGLCLECNYSKKTKLLITTKLPAFLDNGLFNGWNAMGFCVMWFVEHCIHSDGLARNWCEAICTHHDDIGQSVHTRRAPT